MGQISLGWLDYSIMAIYVGFVIGIGYALKKYMKSSSDFFLSGRSIPAWITGLAFMSANLGALELVGMAASGAKYGMATCHFYWVGAIPAMVFLAVFMMPFYYGSKARSVPEYLKMRFDERTRCFNSLTFAVMTVFASGISMNALAKLLSSLLNFHLSCQIGPFSLTDYDAYLWICSGIVLLYVLKGGLTSAIYTEVLQFFMIVMGFAPVVFLGLKDVGGWGKMTHALSGVAQNPAALNLKEAGTTYAANAWTSAWQPLTGGASGNPMGVDIFAMVFGLGFVLSFGYWCTNFLVVQRAMAAKNMTSARRTPLIAAVPKMFLPLLVILPGMIAASLAFTAKDGYRLPPVLIKNEASAAAAVQAVQTATLDQPAAVTAVKKAIGLKMDDVKVAALLTAQAVQPLPETEIRARLQDAVAENDYDGVILSLVKKYCPMGLLGLALTALLASFMSGMAGNVTAFNTVWTYDLYQAYIAKNKSDAHYMTMGRCITVVGILLSIACAYFARNYSNAMDVIQLVFGFVNAPLFATFLLGMFWKRATSHGAFFGLVGGTLTSALFHACTLTTGNVPGIKGGYLAALQYFPSEMAQNFWLAAFAFLTCFALTVSISLSTKRTKSDAELTGLVYSLTPKIKAGDEPWFARPAVLGTLLLIVCVVLNIIFF
ncbi:MAG: sodium:solute symporter family protein [Kiritimatiellales bacterium]|jgi:SSS family solute:Na+ symporter